MKARSPRIAETEPRMNHGWNTDRTEGYGGSWNSPLRMGDVWRSARAVGGRSSTTPQFEIQPRMKHGWNTEGVTARREPRPTGRAPVLRSSYGGWKAPAKPHLCPAFPVPCSIRGRKF